MKSVILAAGLLLMSCAFAQGALTITTFATLPSGTVAVAYSQGLAASGGVTPYTWAVTAGALPGGLTLSTAGLIAGTPTTFGTVIFGVTVTDASSNTAPQTFTLTIFPPPLTITTPATMVAGSLAVPYSQTLSATGGVPPYTWSLTSGALPGGLTLSTGGLISGTPTTLGTANFGVTVTDSSSVTTNQSFSLTTSLAALTITTSSTLPAGVIGVPYSLTLGAVGGVPPYSWLLASGSLPPGFTLSSAGVISGTPATVGVSTFSVNLNDASLRYVSQSFSLSVSASALAIITSSPLPLGYTGVPYLQTLSASGGVPPYSWSVASGSLPAGLALSSSGVISGTPAISGASSFTIQVSDAGLGAASRAFTLTINPTTLAIATPPLSNGVIGVAYSQTLAATGGVPPYTWSIRSGALPGGLTLSSAGVIAGTPSVTGAFSVTILVQDAASATASQSFSLTVTSTGSLSRTGVISQLAAGGGWDTTIWLVNRSASAVPTMLIFHGDDGSPLTLTVTVTQAGVPQQTTAATLNETIAPNTTLVIAAAGSTVLVQGWVDVLSSGPLSGFAVFRDGGAAEAAVPLQGQIAASISLPFDNTGGHSTGVALVNLFASPASITATVWDQNGNLLASLPVALAKSDPAGNGHDAFMLPDRIAITAGIRGIVQFQGNPGSPFATGGDLTGLGLRADPNGLFTSIPTIVP